MTCSHQSSCTVDIEDGLICLTIKSKGNQDMLFRLPHDLAVELAFGILDAAAAAPDSWVTERGKSDG